MQELSRAPNTAERKLLTIKKKLNGKQKVTKSHQSTIKAENGAKYFLLSLAF